MTSRVSACRKARASRHAPRARVSDYLRLRRRASLRQETDTYDAVIPIGIFRGSRPRARGRYTVIRLTKRRGLPLIRAQLERTALGYVVAYVWNGSGKHQHRRTRARFYRKTLPHKIPFGTNVSLIIINYRKIVSEIRQAGFYFGIFRHVKIGGIKIALSLRAFACI